MCRIQFPQFPNHQLTESWSINILNMLNLKDIDILYTLKWVKKLFTKSRQRCDNIYLAYDNLELFLFHYLFWGEVGKMTQYSMIMKSCQNRSISFRHILLFVPAFSCHFSIPDCFCWICQISSLWSLYGLFIFKQPKQMMKWAIQHVILLKLFLLECSHIVARSWVNL